MTKINDIAASKYPIQDWSSKYTDLHMQRAFIAGFDYFLESTEDIFIVVNPENNQYYVLDVFYKEEDALNCATQFNKEYKILYETDSKVKIIKKQLK